LKPWVKINLSSFVSLRHLVRITKVYHVSQEVNAN
jgi:hypothetical protein